MQDKCSPGDPGGSHWRKTELLGWSWALATSLTTASVQQDEEPKIPFAPGSSLDSLQDGLANICLIVTPCFVQYQTPSLVPESSKAQSCPKEQVSLFFSWLNLGITILSPPGHVCPPALLLTLCRRYLGELNPCTGRLRFASGRGTKRARGGCLERMSLRLHLQKDYAPAYFVQGVIFFFPSLPNDINAVPQVDTAISVWRYLCWCSLLLAVIKVAQFMFLD